jgi:hypothetical protein
MRCIITYTSSTATEAFEGAERIFCESDTFSPTASQAMADQVVAMLDLLRGC